LTQFPAMKFGALSHSSGSVVSLKPESKLRNITHDLILPR